MGLAAIVLVAATAAVAFALLAIRPAASEGGSPVALLPDLKELPPADISVCQNPPDRSAQVPGKCPGDTDSDISSRWQLNFSSAVDNVGRGPLIVDGHKSNPDVNVDMVSWPIATRTSGRSTSTATTRTGTCAASSSTSCTA